MMAPSKPFLPPHSDKVPFDVVFVLGAPGSGKGTMCQNLLRDSELNAVHGRQVVHISVGDLLRKHMAEGSLTAEQKEKVKRQMLMDGHELVEIMAVHLNRARGAGNVVLLDGFPRNRDQMDAFKRKMGDISCAISLQCPRAVALQRYLGRHDETRPPGDEELFSTRFAEFEAENQLALDGYGSSLGRLVLEVDIGSSKGSDYNYDSLRRALKKWGHGPWKQH